MSVVASIATEGTRRHARVVVNLDAMVERADGERPALLADLGEGGVAVTAAEAPEVGAAVTIRFRLLKLTCQAHGRVVWRSSSGGFGVAFDDANAQMAGFLRNLAAIPPELRGLYLLDIADPRVSIA